MRPNTWVKGTLVMLASLMAWGRGPRMKKTALVVGEKMGVRAGARSECVAIRLEASEFVADSP